VALCRSNEPPKGSAETTVGISSKGAVGRLSLTILDFHHHNFRRSARCTQSAWRRAADQSETLMKLAIFTRLLRGFLLFLWITILSLVAFQTLIGNLADSLLPIDEASVEKAPLPNGKNDCSLGTLNYYLQYGDDPPPIRAVLEAVLPAWPGAIDCEDYRAQFIKVEGRLRSIARSIARDKNADPKTGLLDTSILIPEFAKTRTLEATAPQMPPEVQEWLLRESTRINDRERQRALLNTSLFLSVLGAFGALIFLVRDYINLDEEKKLSDYIFRPVLGVFLAVAVFVVDVLAHSVISTASILQVRHEPLFILALGAGLLSETAYDWVRRNIDLTFASREEQLRSEQEPLGTPSTLSEVPLPGH
jgi:hypothetical protein